MSDIMNDLNTIREARYGKDVRKSIADGIETCYKEGKAGTTDLQARQDLLTKASKTELDVERKRIDNLAKLPSGSTTGDAELTDIRVGVDGITYNSAGAAVREQVSSLKEDLDGNLILISEHFNSEKDNLYIEWNYKNYSLHTGEELPSTKEFIFTRDLIGSNTEDYFVNCESDDYKLFYIQYTYDGVYEGWSFFDEAFNYNGGVLNQGHRYRIGLAKYGENPTPKIEQGNLVSIWKVASADTTGRISLRWMKQNRSLVTGLVFRNPDRYKQLTTMDKVDCTASSKFVVVRDHKYNGFYLQYDTNGDYVTWKSFQDFGDTNHCMLPKGYKYILLLAKKDDTDVSDIKVTDGESVVVLETGMKNITVGEGEYFDTVKSSAAYATEHTTIYIRNGEYNEDIDLRSKNVTLIGESRDYTIIKTTKNLYSKPPLEISKGYVRNISFISLNTNRPENATEDAAYAVHIDFPEMVDNTLMFENCYLYSDASAAAGIGLRKNTNVKFMNCELVSEKNYGIFCHATNNETVKGGNQILEVSNCKVKSNLLNKCVSIASSLDSSNVATIRSYNSLYIANGAIPTSMNKYHIGTVMGGTFELSADSYGNNAICMNGSLS